jgi:hypothetical protein
MTAKGKLTVSYSICNWSLAWSCARCGKYMALSGDSLESFRQANELMGTGLCAECFSMPAIAKPKPKRSRK